MKYIIGITVIVVLLLSYYLSQRPFVSDLYNYNDWYYMFKNAPILDMIGFHNDKGYFFLNIFFSKVLHLEFRHFLFCGVFFIYASVLSSLKVLFQRITSLELVCFIILILTTVVPFYEVTHFYRQNLACGILILFLISKDSIGKMVLGFISITIHLSCYPFVMVVNACSIFQNLRTKDYKKLWPTACAIVLNTSYFLLIHLTKLRVAMNEGKEYIYEFPVILFWLVLTIFALYCLFDRQRSYILEDNTRQSILLVFLSWIGMKAVFTNNHNLSIRLGVFSGVLMMSLFLATFQSRKVPSRYQQVGLLVLTFTAIVYFVDDLNLSFSF